MIKLHIKGTMDTVYLCPYLIAAVNGTEDGANRVVIRLYPGVTG